MYFYCLALKLVSSPTAKEFVVGAIKSAFARVSKAAGVLAGACFSVLFVLRGSHITCCRPTGVSFNHQDFGVFASNPPEKVGVMLGGLIQHRG